jgi:hypothetical protein
MAEYIGKAALYEKFAELEHKTRETLIGTASGTSAYTRNSTWLSAFTMVNILLLIFPPLTLRRWAGSVPKTSCRSQKPKFWRCVRNGYRFICPVIFEDGTMLTQNSMWNWYELENYGTYSEENDDYFVPEGWWENRQFTPDDIYNNPVDCTVTHWMPLPELPMSARMDGYTNKEEGRGEQ